MKKSHDFWIYLHEHTHTNEIGMWRPRQHTINFNLLWFGFGLIKEFFLFLLTFKSHVYIKICGN